MRHPKSAMRLTTLVVGFALAATACGGDTETTTSSGGEGEPAAESIDLSGASFTVGSKEFTEQLILGQMTRLVLEDAGADVTDETGITGTTNVRKALTSDEIDMYWEYTGTGFSEILGNEVAEAPTDSQELFDAVAQQDLKENSVQWVALSPMDNAYAIATSATAQEETGVTTLSDYAELVSSDPDQAGMCAASEFIDRADGLPGVEKAYGFELPDEAITEVDLGIIFTRVPEGDPCNFGEVFATDGRIPANDMVVVEDDKNFFLKYNVALTVNQDVMEQYPELEDVFTPIAEKLDTETMQSLNAAVDVDGLPAEAVAEQWLQENGFIG